MISTLVNNLNEEDTHAIRLLGMPALDLQQGTLFSQTANRGNFRPASRALDSRNKSRRKSPARRRSSSAISGPG
jgi:hypothetical protein